jgi:membrane-associated phospholipid phosphatase
VLYQTELYPARGFHSVTETPLKGQGQAIDGAPEIASDSGMSRLTHPWPLPAGRTSWLIAAAAAVALLALMSLIDVMASRAGQALPAPVVAFFEIVTLAGDSAYTLYPSLAGIVAFAVLAGLASSDARKAAFRRLAGLSGFIFVGVGLPSLVTTIIKRLVGRSRPEHLDAVGAFDFRSLSWVDWTYQSFPSGHATTGFALCFVVGFLFPRAFPGMLVLAILVGLSRIVVGAHYPTDVVAGAAIGILGAYVVRNVFAARGWLFEHLPDGRIGAPSHRVLRGLALLR